MLGTDAEVPMCVLVETVLLDEPVDDCLPVLHEPLGELEGGGVQLDLGRTTRVRS
jgi:hypothetical protein